MRFVIIGIVIAVAFTLYALVDAAMTDGSRARGVSKPVWVLLVVVLPVIGGVLWFLIGKGQARPAGSARPAAPDDDPRFTGTRMSDTDLDAHMRDLEARLRELDSETFPGEEPRASAAPEPAAETPPAPAPKPKPRDGGVSGDEGDAREGGARADGDAAQP